MSFLARKLGDNFEQKRGQLAGSLALCGAEMLAVAMQKWKPTCCQAGSLSERHKENVISHLDTDW